MSAIKSWSLACDHPECADADAFSNAGFYDSAASLRRDAKANGWVRRNGKDYCPDHADNPGADR